MVKLTRTRTDVLVIGGGPAGLAAAIAIRLKGFDVTVVDAARPPIDKACGEGIPPAGVEVLQRLGLRLSAGAFPLRGIRFLDRGASVEASFPFGPGLALRRIRLHQLFVNRAEELGVRLLWGTRISDTSTLPACRWLVGADGQNSCVRHAAGLDAARTESFRFGFRQHYRISPWTDFVEVHWGSRCQVYVTPVSDDEIRLAPRPSAHGGPLSLTSPHPLQTAGFSPPYFPPTPCPPCHNSLFSPPNPISTRAKNC